MATAPSNGPAARNVNAQRRPTSREIQAMNRMDTTVTEKPIPFWIVRAVPVYSGFADQTKRLVAELVKRRMRYEVVYQP